MINALNSIKCRSMGQCSELLCQRNRHFLSHLTDQSSFVSSDGFVGSEIVALSIERGTEPIRFTPPFSSFNLLANFMAVAETSFHTEMPLTMYSCLLCYIGVKRDLM